MSPMSTRSPWRSRVAAVALAVTLPLGAVVTLTPSFASPGATEVAATMDSSDVDRLIAEAKAAEDAAKRAEDAVPVAKAKIKPATERARKTRDRVQKLSKPVQKLQKRVNNRAKKVKQRQRALNRAKTAGQKRKARVQLRKARAQVKQTRVNLKKRRTTLRAARATNQNAWATVNQFKDDHTEAVAQVKVTAQVAEEKRDVADTAVAEVTPITSVKAELLPQIAGAGASTAEADAAKNVITVGVTPALRLVGVEVQRRGTDGTWKTSTSARTRADGRVDVPVDSNGTYRVVVKDHTTATLTEKRSLDYSDEFNGGLSDDWVHRVQVYNPEGMRACSKGSPEATTTTGDTVRLWVKKDTSRKADCKAFYNGTYYPNHSYRLNGHIGTQGTYDFTYGVAAARVKFQSATEGQIGAFWLQPSSHAPGGFGPDYQGAEIDVVEFTGYRPNADVGHMHMSTYANDSAGALTRASSGILPDDVVRTLVADKDDKWFNRYHVFSVEWTPTEYVFRVDGTEVWRTSENVSSRPQYPIFSLLSSDYAIARAGAEGEKNLGSQFMEVDWVRVWN